MSAELNQGLSQIFREMTVTEKVEVPLKYLEEDVPEHVKKFCQRQSPQIALQLQLFKLRICWLER